MNRIVRSAQAGRDVLAIWAYIAADDPDAADRHLSRIDEKLAFLAQWPEGGAPRPLIGRGVRSFAVGRYIILYRPIPDGIRVLRVINAARRIGRGR